MISLNLKTLVRLHKEIQELLVQYSIMSPDLAALSVASSDMDIDGAILRTHVSLRGINFVFDYNNELKLEKVWQFDHDKQQWIIPLAFDPYTSRYERIYKSGVQVCPYLAKAPSLKIHPQTRRSRVLALGDFAIHVN